MRNLVVVTLLLCIGFALATSVNVARVEQEANSDGTGCAICVFALTEVNREIKKGATDIAKFLSGFCQVFTNEKLRGVCQSLISHFGADFIKWILKREEPDWICSTLKICKQCHLTYNSEQYYSLPREERAKRGMDDDIVHTRQLRARVFSGIFEAQFFQAFADKNRMNFTYPNIPPKVDLDGDGFSSVHLCHRGADWRGKDCNDLSNKIHPGIREDTASPYVDSNCNGISGKDSQGRSYESQFCDNFANDRSMAFFGDSASAAFSIPAEWIDLNLTDIFPALVNELDWPMKSFASGWSDDIQNRSLYLKWRQHNRCAHRQFQNLAVNGATMSSLVGQIQDAKFERGTMKPIFLWVGYIGNDICRKSLDQMTTPQDFRKQLLEGLALLDSIVPANSRAVLFGLVDGSILWDNTWNLTHPLGGINYAQFYKFLTCAGMNPCNTWLTSDAASRAAATKRSIELDDVVEDVVKNVKLQHIQLAFLDFSKMLDECFAILKQKGIPLHELIDDVDGFHPSLNLGHRMLADLMWQHLQDVPNFLGPDNPSNDAIAAKFGDQGGY